MEGTYQQAGLSRLHLRRRVVALSGILAAAALVAACGSSNSSNSPGGTGGSGGGSGGKAPAAKGVVSARQLSGIGTVLVTSSGMTIYTPKTPAETNGNIKCTGSCNSFWLPVTAKTADPTASGLPGKLGTIQIPGGKTQLTYNGRPLYTFTLDTAAGQAHGNNFHDSFNGTNFTWQVVTSSGKPASGGSPAPAPSYSQRGY